MRNFKNTFKKIECLNPHQLFPKKALQAETIQFLTNLGYSSYSLRSLGLRRMDIDLISYSQGDDFDSSLPDSWRAPQILARHHTTSSCLHTFQYNLD